MDARAQRAKRWVVGYLAALFGTLPFALPCWNGGLRDSLGRFVSIEQVHLAEYVGLGWVVAWYARTRGQALWRQGRLCGLLVAVGVLDELVQGWLPQRVFQASDILLNWAGSLLGLGGLHAWCWLRSGADGAQQRGGR